VLAGVPQNIERIVGRGNSGRDLVLHTDQDLAQSISSGAVLAAGEDRRHGTVEVQQDWSGRGEHGGERVVVGHGL
jgi:hypothetical protein